MLGLLKSVYAELPRVYWTIWLGTLVNKLGSVVLPFLALYLTQERALSKSATGLLISLYGVGAILAGLTGGMLADHVGDGSRCCCRCLGCGGDAGNWRCRDLPMLALAVLLMGWLSEMYRPAVAALIADVVPPEKRIRAFGLLYWVINLGFAVAMTIGGLAASKSFLMLFVLDALTMTLYGVLVFFKVPETRPIHPESSDKTARPGLLDVIADGPFCCWLGSCLASRW